MSERQIIFFLCLLPFFCFTQPDAGFAWPIDTPHVITGNYGELRPNHFHMGWDFSTNAKIGLPVYAIADGYVSRIKVSSTGYGKAIYIAYPDNKLSVCAHLTSYTGLTSEAVKKEQNSKQKYEIELFPAINEIKVTKGEIIGYSGNSGNSSGPHLHFEIRDRQTEIPMNLSQFYYLNDSVKPDLRQIGFYDLSDTSNPVFLKSFKIKTNKNDSLFIHKDSLIINHSILGLAFEGFDRFVPKGNPNVIYKASLFFDGNLIFTYIMNNISFDDQRYVNEFAETINKVKYQKCFLPTVYPDALYKNCVNKGRIVLRDTVFHLLKLTVSDEKSNENSVQFHFRVRKINDFAQVSPKRDLYVDCTKELKVSARGLNLSIPAGTLYYSTILSVVNNLNTDSKFSITPSSPNFASSLKIGFVIPQKLLPQKNKLVLKNNATVYVPLSAGDSIVYAIYAFGHFQLLKDTIAPKVKTQLTPKKIKRIKKFESFSFVVRDNLSGLGKFHVFINDQWVLVEYDAKSNLLTYFFDEKTPDGNLEFRVETEDRVGNAATFKYTLKR